MSTGRELARNLMCLCMLAMQAENNSVTIPLEMAGDVVDALSLSEEVKPCPFCGRNENLVVIEVSQSLDDIIARQYKVCCSAEGDSHGGCGASCGYKLSKEEAFDAWNTRA